MFHQKTEIFSRQVQFSDIKLDIYDDKWLSLQVSTHWNGCFEGRPQLVKIFNSWLKMFLSLYVHGSKPLYSPEP